MRKMILPADGSKYSVRTDSYGFWYDGTMSTMISPVFLCDRDGGGWQMNFFLKAFDPNFCHEYTISMLNHYI